MEERVGERRLFPSQLLYSMALGGRDEGERVSNCNITAKDWARDTHHASHLFVFNIFDFFFPFALFASGICVHGRSHLWLDPLFLLSVWFLACVYGLPVQNLFDPIFLTPVNQRSISGNQRF